MILRTQHFSAVWHTSLFVFQQGAGGHKSRVVWLSGLLKRMGLWSLLARFLLPFCLLTLCLVIACSGGMSLLDSENNSLADLCRVLSLPLAKPKSIPLLNPSQAATEALQAEVQGRLRQCQQREPEPNQLAAERRALVETLRRQVPCPTQSPIALLFDERLAHTAPGQAERSARLTNEGLGLGSPS